MSTEKTITFFHAVNTSQRIAGVAFEPVDVFAGTICGVFFTDDPVLTETLKAQPHVEVITQEVYEAKLKKKIPSLSERLPSNRNTSLPDKASIREPAGVVVESQSSSPTAAPAAENLLEPRPIIAPPSPGRRKVK